MKSLPSRNRGTEARVSVNINATYWSGSVLSVVKRAGGVETRAAPAVTDKEKEGRMEGGKERRYEGRKERREEGRKGGSRGRGGTRSPFLLSIKALLHLTHTLF